MLFNAIIKNEIIYQLRSNNEFINILCKPIDFLINALYNINRKKNPVKFVDVILQKYDLKLKGIIHIGAHLGQEYEIYRKHEISNLLFFEPLPNVFKELEKKIKEKAILVNFALGNSNTKIKMHVDHGNKGASSSILKPKLHLKQHPEIKFDNRTVEVRMVRLDDFSKLNPDLKITEKYNFIIIDVQGYELEVFKGSKAVLQNIDYIITEVNRDELYEGCAMVEELDDFLREFGFKRMKTVWSSESDGDALYIKRFFDIAN